MKAPLATFVGEARRAHGCITKLFLWLNSQKRAEGGQDICMSQCRINSTRFPCRIPLCLGWCQSSEMGLHVSEQTSVMVELFCLKTYWGKSETRVSPSCPSLFLNFLAEAGLRVTSLFSCSPLGSVGIPLSMMKTTPNSLSRSLRRSMSLTLHIGMTSPSLVRKMYACLLQISSSGRENAPCIMYRSLFN